MAEQCGVESVSQKCNELRGHKISTLRNASKKTKGIGGISRWASYYIDEMGWDEMEWNEIKKELTLKAMG